MQTFEALQVNLRQMKALSSEQANALAKLAAYPFAQVREKVLKEELVAEDRVDEAIAEFRKYLSLIALDYKGIGMISPEVDQVWHMFILFTKDYATFCEDVFGRFIHHRPATSLTPIPSDARSKFIQAYQEVFGEFPAIWGDPSIGPERCAPSTNCQPTPCCPGYVDD